MYLLIHLILRLTTNPEPCIRRPRAIPTLIRANKRPMVSCKALRFLPHYEAIVGYGTRIKLHASMMLVIDIGWLTLNKKR